MDRDEPQHKGNPRSPEREAGRGPGDNGTPPPRTRGKAPEDQATRPRRWTKANQSSRGRPAESSAQPVMILPQVHLRKPCYDFYFL